MTILEYSRHAALALALVGLAACGQDDGADDATVDAEGTTTVEDVTRETEEALQAARRLAEQERAEFLAEAERDLKGLRARMQVLSDDIQSRMDEFDADARERWRETLEDLEEEREDAAEEFDRLESASGDAWNEIRDGFVSAYEQFSAELEAAESDQPVDLEADEPPAQLPDEDRQ